MSDKASYPPLPATIFPVGTLFPKELLLPINKDPVYDSNYIDDIMKQAERDTRKVLESLKRDGTIPRTGHKLGEGTKSILKSLRELITNPEQVVVAGHMPTGQNVGGSLSNDCYLTWGSGLRYDLILCFRGEIEVQGKRNRIAYVHPHGIYSEVTLQERIKNELRPFYKEENGELIQLSRPT